MLTLLVASLVQPVISSVVKGISGRGFRRAGKGYLHKKKELVPLHRLNNIKITNNFNYETRFNGVFPRNNLRRINDEAYVINLDDKKVKEHITFHYLLTELQLYTGIIFFILLELNIFLKKY